MHARAHTHSLVPRHVEEPGNEANFSTAASLVPEPDERKREPLVSFPDHRTGSARRTMEEDGAQLPVATELQIRALCEDLVACLTRILDPECPQAERAECDQVLLIAAHQNLLHMHRIKYEPNLLQRLPIILSSNSSNNCLFFLLRLPIFPILC